MRCKIKKWYNIKTGCIVVSDKKPGKEWERLGEDSLVFWSPLEQRYKALHRLGRDIYNFLALLQEYNVPCSYEEAFKLLQYHRAMRNITWFPRQIRLLHTDAETYIKMFEDILKLALFMKNYNRVKRVVRSIFELEKILGIEIFNKLPAGIISAIIKVLNP